MNPVRGVVVFVVTPDLLVGFGLGTWVGCGVSRPFGFSVGLAVGETVWVGIGWISVGVGDSSGGGDGITRIGVGDGSIGIAVGTGDGSGVLVGCKGA